MAKSWRKKAREWKRAYRTEAQANVELSGALEDVQARLDSDAAIIRDLVAVIDKLTDGVTEGEPDEQAQDWCIDARCQMEGEHIRGGTTCIDAEGNALRGQ